MCRRESKVDQRCLFMAEYFLLIEKLERLEALLDLCGGPISGAEINHAAPFPVFLNVHELPKLSEYAKQSLGLANSSVASSLHR